VVGVELQETLAALAARNVALNGMGDRVAILRADIRELDRTTRPGSFATAFANPPYRRAGTGRLCADPERATARHDLTLPLAALASALRHLLAPAGRFYLTWKPERGTELADALSREGLGITLLRPVVSRVGDPPFLLLCGGEEGMGNGPPATLPPLVVRGPGGYEAEVAHLLAHGSFPDQSPRVAIHG
jgi:tRNA1Val (adenine37-N6)-methyltransferase